MSLSYQFDKKGWDNLSVGERERSDLFVWGCLSVGLRGITEKNAEEWAWRYAFSVKLNGAYYYAPDRTPIIPDVDEVRKYIGLTTNVSDITHKQFVDKEVKRFRI